MAVHCFCRLSLYLQIVWYPVSLSDNTFYRKISWSLKAVRLEVWIMAYLWNLADTLPALQEQSYNSEYKYREFASIKPFRAHLMKFYSNLCVLYNVKKIHLKIQHAKGRPCCSEHNVLLFLVGRSRILCNKVMATMTRLYKLRIYF